MKKIVVLMAVLCMALCSSACGDTIAVDINAHGTEMSQTLYGLFYEDINYGADGGLYAELLMNRSFENRTILNPMESQSYGGWIFNQRSAAKGSAKLTYDDPIHLNNKTYVTLTVEEGVYRLLNEGYGATTLAGGIPLDEGAEYRFSVYLRNVAFDGSISVGLVDRRGNPLSNEGVIVPEKSWTKHEIILTAVETTQAYLCVAFDGVGQIEVDMLSLIPRDVYGSDWQNGGLRGDLVQALKDLNPKFIRFPGGCIAEGSYTWDNAYNWKDTIGPVEQRKENPNTWGYMQSYGLGYHEYFQLCEDFGAQAVPVVHAGVLCQAREPFEMPLLGEELETYIQDVFDLIEYATGDITTYWGAKRGENGHAEPFELNYLAVGNENWGSTYFTNYGKITKALKEVYPDIIYIAAAGPVAEGGLIDDSWRTIRARFPYDMVDEHYYMDSDWFLNNTHRYDSYSRTTNPVFLGEFAAHEPDAGGRRPNNLYSALCEAAYLTGIERNSDVVKMSCYAPLLARHGMQQWTPDLIWFNERETLLTPNYYVQQMFASTLGTQVLPTEAELSQGAYHVVTRTSDAVYVKLVNVTDTAKNIAVKLTGIENGKAAWQQLTGQPEDVNGFTLKDKVTPVLGASNVSGGILDASLPPWSVTIFTIQLD